MYSNRLSGGDILFIEMDLSHHDGFYCIDCKCESWILKAFDRYETDDDRIRLNINCHRCASYASALFPESDIFIIEHGSDIVRGQSWHSLWNMKYEEHHNLFGSI